MSASGTGKVEYQVVHDTVYQYAYQVTHGQHYAHLTPRFTANQEVLWHSLQFSPEPVESCNIRDYFGNHCRTVQIQDTHDHLRVTSTTLVRITPRQRDAALDNQPWENALAPSVFGQEALEIADMRQSSPLTPLLPDSARYARRFLQPGRPWLEALLDLTVHIRKEFTYDPGATRVDTPLSEVFAHKRGVCQDFAHLILSCLRSQGLAARYVSGYVLNDPPPGQEKAIGSDASHAWVESWLPGQGWVGFDPTNGKVADEEFITIGWGRDYGDIPPLRGVVLGGGEHELDVRVAVTRLAGKAAAMVAAAKD